MLFTNSIKFPNIFNLSNGDTQVDRQYTSINRCIALILTTGKGELLGDPDFGANLYEMLFNVDTETLQEEIKTNIKDSIEKYEKRITIDNTNISIEYNKDTKAYTIHITYTIKNSDISSSTDVSISEEDYFNRG